MMITFSCIFLHLSMLSPRVGWGLERGRQTQGGVTFSVKSRPFKSQILTTYDLFCRNEGALQKNSSTFCFQFVPGCGGGGVAVLYLALIGLLNRSWFSGFRVLNKVSFWNKSLSKSIFLWSHFVNQNALYVHLA